MVSSSAHAQQWLSDRSRTQGRGILVGTLELHPGIGAEVGYDSNVFLSEEPESSGILRVTPSLYVSTLSGERLQGAEPKLSFRAGVNGSLKSYFATDQGTDIGIGQDAKLTWNASSIFALELFQDFKRAIDPFGEPQGVTIDTDSSDDEPLQPDGTPAPTGLSDRSDNFRRHQIGGGTRLQLSTPGRLLKGGLGYRIDYDNFTNSAYDVNDSLKHTIGADTSWEFLPKTALFWNGAFRIHDYINADDSALGQRFGSKSIGNKLGINGALTERVGFTIAGGYDATFADNDADREAVTAQVEARWRFIETSQWALGYDRTLQLSFQGGTMQVDRIKTALNAMFGGVFALGLRADFAFIDYGEDDELGERDDKQLTTSLSGEYRFVDWFAVTGEVGYLQNFTDFEVRVPIVDEDGMNVGTVTNAAKYRRFEAWLGVRAFL